MSCDSQHVEDIHNALSVMQKTLECPICLDLMKEPVTTRCDHTFCRFCMSQLLSRKKKGRAQCPMCKKDVTKRSLQESPRFKLLIDGLKKIINAFELDSGYKFSPSQDHVKNILMTCEERKEEQTVVQSTGYRNRNRKRTLNGDRCEDHTTLLETNIDTLLTRDAETEIFSRLQSKKQETNAKCKRTLNTEFESSHSKDDLFKNTNSLGNECGRSYLLSELEEDDESAKSQDEELNICENVSLKPETDEVMASDLAEYGFSERDLESTRSNLLCMEGARSLKDTTAKKRSSEARDSIILDVDIADREAEQRLLCELAEDTMHSEHNDQAGSTTQSKKYIHDESQSLKIAIANQYYKGDSVPEDVTSNQSSPLCMLNAVPRKRLKISIQRVNEWLQKTSEFLNAMPWDEELLSDVFPELDEDLSDKGSCMSSETEITTKPCPSSVSGAVEKTVSVRDKIFGKVYKREKKSSPLPKITVLANVHVNGGADSQKINDIPKRLTNSLEPENFIRKVETTDNSYTNDGDTLLANNNLLNTDRVSIQNSTSLNNDKSNAQETKLKTQNKSLKRKSENALSTRTLQSLLLVKGSDISMDKPSPSRFSEIEINTYPSSNESGHKDDQRNVRRSRRLNVLSKKALPSPNQKAAKTSGKLNKNIDPACLNSNADTNFQAKEMCTTFKKSEDKITTMLAPNGKVVPFVTDVEIHPAPPDCETSQLTDVGVQESWNMPVGAVRNVSSAENIDSDTDTQHLIKAFKSAKRMSFKLDPVNEIDKNHSIPIHLSDTKNNLPNGSQAGIALTVSYEKEATHTDDAILSNGRNLSKFNVGGEAMQQNCHDLILPTRQGETSERLNVKFENKLVFSSKKSVDSSMEEKDMPMLYESEMLSAGQLDLLNPVNDTEPHKEDNLERDSVLSKSELLVLCSQSPSMRQGETRGVTTEGENEQVKKAYRKPSFHEEQVNQITSENRSQGSVTEKLLEHSVTCQSSSLKSPEVYSETPDGLLGFADQPGEEHSFCAEAEKSFVFCKEIKVGVSDSSRSLNDSPFITRKKRKAPMLESSENESSDEELPCFSKLLFGNASNSAGQKNALSGFSPKQQGGGVLDMFSSNSTSGKTQASLNFPGETLLGSQESVNLFSSQSNTSDHPTDVIIDQELKHDQSECHEKNSKRKGDPISSNKQVQKEDYETTNNYEDTCKEQNLDEGSECESEGSHFSTLSSQCEVFDTQQRDALRNNLEKLQEEMAALEAVLEQHNTPGPSCKKMQASTAELNTIRLQEASQKQTDHGANISPDAVPGTKMPSLRSVEQPIQRLDIGSESSTPPLSPHQTRSRKQTPEKVCSKVSIFQSFKENALIQEEPKSMELSAECHPSTKEPDTCKRPAASLSQPTASPRRSLRSTTRNIGTMNAISTDGRRVFVEAKPQSQKRKANIGDMKRSSSPVFTSPKRSRRGSTSNKIPVVTNRRNFSLVASGLNQSEMMLVQKFARKTQSVFCSEISESTTHVVIKTDEYLVCHRTMKYFLGIAGRKWVVSHNWIVQSFREGRILDEYDFEVKGDVISGINHRGPRRSRLGSDGLLLSDFEICCLGSFKDMTRENLEWMVSLCGASFVMEPQMFKHKEGNTSLVVVQGDEQTDYAAMRKRYRALVVTREWVLDSVSSYKLQPFDSYLV